VVDSSWAMAMVMVERRKRCTDLLAFYTVNMTDAGRISRRPSMKKSRDAGISIVGVDEAMKVEQLLRTERWRI
jgi:hypothetical protein